MTDTPKEFTPPASQEALDAIINGAVARTHKQYEGFDDYKAKAEQFDALDQQATPADTLEQAREEGRAEGRAVLAQERVMTALNTALTGRALSANALLDFDRSRFVKGDSADTDAITEWVNANSTEVKTTTEVVPFSGNRSGSESGGSVQSGRDRFRNKRTPQNKEQ
ncbi:hypothetical protein [Microbacterium sp.]|uniref:hypothetical protein n=1 Tax=Microbacterium sp. TaxID=51671 RepID=UPI002FE3C13B